MNYGSFWISVYLREAEHASLMFYVQYNYQYFGRNKLRSIFLWSWKKNVSTYTPSRKYKSKKQEILLHTYWNGQNPKRRQHQRLARTRRAETRSPLGMQNGTATRKDSLVFSHETINRLLSCDPALVLLGIYPMSGKLTFTQKPAYRRLLTTART